MLCRRGNIFDSDSQECFPSVGMSCSCRESRALRLPSRHYRVLCHQRVTPAARAGLGLPIWRLCNLFGMFPMENKIRTRSSRPVVPANRGGSVWVHSRPALFCCHPAFQWLWVNLSLRRVVMAGGDRDVPARVRGEGRCPGLGLCEAPLP